MTYDLVTFGETMIRLSPPHFLRLEQTHSLDVQVGGAELNVAVTAQRLGLRTAYVTRLARNPLGRMIQERGYHLYNVNNLKIARFREIFPGGAKTIGSRLLCLGFMVSSRMDSRKAHKLAPSWPLVWRAKDQV